MGATDSELRVIFKGIDQSLSRTAGGASKAIAGMGKAVAAGAAVGAAAIVGLGAAVLKLASDAEPVAGVRDAFAGLTKEITGGSSAMLAALVESSNGVISNTALMTSFNKAAQLVGISFAETLPDAMGPLGKVAAATGQDMGFLLDSLVTGVGRLSPMILDNLGIQVDLTKAYEDYALSIGKTTDELTKTEQQAALTAQVMQKLGENTANMPDAAPTFAQLKTALTNLKDEIGVQLLPVVQPMIEKFAQFARDVLPVVAQWLGTNIPIAAAAMADFWTGTLQPAIEAVWGWLSTVLIPLLRDEVVPWLQVYVPIAIQALSDFWTDVLQPAVTEVWNWLSTVLVPFLRDTLAPFIGEILVARIQRLSDFWTKVLKPALDVVWAFLSEKMMPIWEAIEEYLGVLIPLVLTALKGTWENVLLPALTRVWEFISEKLGPVFQWLKDSVLTPTSEAFGTLSGIIQGVADWIGRLTDKLREVTLPDWMTPGSPTPWELGLAGVRRELQALYSGDLPALNAQMQGLSTVTNNQSVLQTTNIYTSRVDTRGESAATMRFLLGGI